MSKPGDDKKKNDEAFAYDLANKVNENHGLITKEEIDKYIDTYDKIRNLAPKDIKVQGVGVNYFGDVTVTDKGENHYSTAPGQGYKGPFEKSGAELGEFERSAYRLGGHTDNTITVGGEKQPAPHTPMSFTKEEFADATKRVEIVRALREELQEQLKLHPEGLDVQEFKRAALGVMQRQEGGVKQGDPKAKDVPSH